MRKLIMDICDYENNVVCNLYDNNAQINGQAANVVIRTERNGWKELSFSLPSVCETENGIENNYRLEYLKADWSIRTEDDDGVDWYIISESRITHNNFSKEVEVTAGHISQRLKYKNLGLEFSDNEGNNIGTVAELLQVILNGTGWSAGHVSKFMEDDDPTKEKRRSLNVPVKSGAFKMITAMCEQFAAKPVFNGDMTVDILPMNPFSHVITYEQTSSGEIMKVGKIITLENGEIPTAAEHCEILELHYDRYLQGITRTLNTENIVTKLTASGNPGDTKLGACSLINATHKRYTYMNSARIKAGECIKIFADNNNVYYFRAKNNIAAFSVFTFSMLDNFSKSYLWCEGTAHKRIEDIGDETPIVIAMLQWDEEEQNWMNYLFDFSYYDKSGLMSDAMFQAAAEFQQVMPGLVKTSYEKNIELSEAQTRLSEIGESNNGFLKLAVSNISTLGPVRLTIDKTQGENGVLFRSDYDEPRRKYFTWYATEKLKTDGSSVDGIGSVVYAIKKRKDSNNNELPPVWKMAYVRSIDDAKTTRKDIYGNLIEKCSNFEYIEHEDDPSFITLFANDNEFSSLFGTSPQDDVNFYLFCANAMTGMLGSKQAAVEGVMDALSSSTKVVTDTHPTVFCEWQQGHSNHPEIDSVTNTYAWVYDYKHYDDTSIGDLFFYCYGVFNNNMKGWHSVYHQETEPTPVNTPAYYFNTRYKTLYHSNVDGTASWIKMESPDEKRIAQDFSKVLYFCLRRDMLYKGIYERYEHSIAANTTFYPGNYAIKNQYGFYWVFTTKKPLHGGNSASENYTNIVYDSNKQSTLSTTAMAWYEYSFSTEVKIEFYDNEDNLISEKYYNGVGSFQTPTNAEGAQTTANHIVISRETLPVREDEYVKAKECKLWVDTQDNVVYMENDMENVVEAQSKGYDTVQYPAENILAEVNFASGGVSDTGVDTSNKSYKRSYNVDIYPRTDYVCSLPARCTIVLYDSNKYYTRTLPASTTSFTTQANEKYLKIVLPNSTTFNPSSHYIRVYDYLNKIYVNDQMYTIIDAVPSGGLKGINNLMSLFVDATDEIYGENGCLTALLDAQEEIKTNETNLMTTLGDLYREGWWQNNDYVKGDEQKLYTDALRNLTVAAQPEAKYDIKFLDLYGTDEDEDGAKYPDINITYAVHLVDPEIDLNLWAYMDQLSKCYDQPRKTQMTVNTDLSNMGQQSFSDTMSYIADVAKITKANQSVYARAANFSSDGYLATDKLEGIISTSANKLSGGSSNWYTDDKGNIVIESQDGLNAMMLTGVGYMVANGKSTDGDWNWRSFGTGEGFTADEINAGTINGLLIKAGTVNTSAVVSNFGQELDIASNRTLNLYATVDGVQPSGGLDTGGAPGAGDSYIIIQASYKEEGAETDTTTAKIDIASGGAVNVFGGSGVNIQSGGNIHIAAGGDFTVESDKFEIDENGDVRIEGIVTALGGKIAGFDITRETTVNPGTGITEFTRGYISYGPTSLSSTTNGVYVGTDGIRVNGTNNGVNKSFYATSSGDVYMSGEVNASSGTIANWYIGTDYIGNANTYASSTVGLSCASGKNAFWAKSSGGTTLFSVTHNGYLSATGANISGTLTAGAGSSIGGWYIGTDYIGDANSYSGSKVGMSSSSSYNAFWARAAGNSPATSFSVTHDGVLTATGANVTGTLTATGGSVGGWVIGNDFLADAASIDESTIGLRTGSTSNDNVFWIGKTSSTTSNFDTAPFRIMKSGKELWIGGWHIILADTGLGYLAAPNQTTANPGLLQRAVFAIGEINDTNNTKASYINMTGTMLINPRLTGFVPLFVVKGNDDVNHELLQYSNSNDNSDDKCYIDLEEWTLKCGGTNGVTMDSTVKLYVDGNIYINGDSAHGTTAGTGRLCINVNGETKVVEVDSNGILRAV